MRIDLGTAPTHDLRDFGIRTNHRQRGKVLRLERKKIALVLEEDDPFRACFPNERTMFWQVEGLLWSLLPLLEETRLDQELQQATDASTNVDFCHLALIDGIQQILFAPARQR